MFSFGAASTEQSSKRGSEADSSQRTKPFSSFGAAAQPASSTTTAAPPSFGFGATSNTTTAPATIPTTFGFGSTPAASANSTTTTGFGSTPAATSSSLFGSTPAGATSSFGLSASSAPQSTAASAPAQASTSLFAPASSTQTAQNLGMSLGASTVNQQTIDRSTKFNTLPVDVQKKLNEFHKRINDSFHLAESLEIASTRDLLKTDVLREYEMVMEKYQGVRNLLDRNETIVNKLKEDTSRELLDTDEMAHRIFDAMIKQGGPGSISIGERNFNSPNDFIFKYFATLSSSLRLKQEKLDGVINSLTETLKSISSGEAGVSGSGNDIRGLSEVLKVNFSTFMQLAGKVADLHQQVEKLEEAAASSKKLAFSSEKESARNVDYSKLASKVATMTPQQLAPAYQMGASTTAPSFGFGNLNTSTTSAPSTTGFGSSTFGAGGFSFKK